jgi:hypothetical protein
MGEGRNMYRVSAGNPKEKSHGRPRSRWEDEIKMDLTDIGCGCVEWIHRDRWGLS